jgi:hypothetical protein
LAKGRHGELAKEDMGGELSTDDMGKWQRKTWETDGGLSKGDMRNYQRKTREKKNEGLQKITKMLVGMHSTSNASKAATVWNARHARSNFTYVFGQAPSTLFSVPT